MKKLLLPTVTLLCLSNLIIGQGLKLDPEKYKTIEKWKHEESMGFTSQLPSSISLRAYCPKPLKQEASNCVGWAVAYAALSTQYNIDMGTTNYMHKWARAFDPNFIYNFVKKDGDYWCQIGSSISDAMNVLGKYGCKPMVWEPWLKCEDATTYNEFTIALAAQYKIKDWYALSKDNLLYETKSALANKFPVIIGAMLTESFERGSAVNFGYWNPVAGEKYTGAHAMCVIGYDDYKYGGAFEVMNSWGKDWGDKGCFWIKYNDFANLVYEAYIMLTQPINKSSCSFGDCYSNYSRYKFNDGGIYEGIFTEGYLDGFGSYLYTNGSFYVGGWKMGRKNGWGMLYDAPSGFFYNTLYNNDVLMEYSEKSYGFAQSEAEKKAQAHLNEIKKIILGTEKEITDFEQAKKALQEYEAPDKPLKLEKKK
jgi:hypothetical protein